MLLFAACAGEDPSVPTDADETPSITDVIAGSEPPATTHPADATPSEMESPTEPRGADTQALEPKPPQAEAEDRPARAPQAAMADSQAMAAPASEAETPPEQECKNYEIRARQAGGDGPY